MLKKSLVCAVMLVAVAGLAFASTGGGKKKTSKTPNPAFVPLRTGSFSLKSKPEYSVNNVFSSFNQKHNVVKSVITYQKGNTIYVMPSQYRIVPSSRLSFKSNLNVIDLKIRLCK